MTLRAIIMCAGEGTRWTGEPPKHLVAVDGEVLLHRTVRMLSDRGVTDIHVSVRRPDARYAVRWATTHVVEDNVTEIDKFYSTRHLWVADTRMFYGDVFYTDEAMDRITSSPPEPFRFFGRRRRSKITGTAHGEIFALCFTDREVVESACLRIRTERLSGTLRRGGSWELYQVLQGHKPSPYGRQKFDWRFTHIDDWTEDFDTREEYEEWSRRRRVAVQLA